MEDKKDQMPEDQSGSAYDPAPPAPPATPATPAPPAAPPAQVPVARPASLSGEKPVSVTVNMPRQRRRWLATLLVICIVIILYLVGIIAGLTGSGYQTKVLVRGDVEHSKVAVWEVSGMINAEQADRFENFYREIMDDSAVQAVVVRVDSPGGAVSPSDRMNRVLTKIRQSGRKTVVSMGSVAASGGYFISAAADWIYAEPSTITGSIGVISMIPVIKGAADLLGVNFVVIRSTRSQDYKAAMNYFEDPSQQAIDEHRKVLDGIHEQFLQTVARGRTKLGEEGVSPLANGRVWLGAEALELGLVDEIGYCDQAIDKAADMAGLTDPHVVKYSEKSGFASKLMGARTSGVTIDSSLVDGITSPRIMLLWRP